MLNDDVNVLCVHQTNKPVDAFKFSQRAITAVNSASSSGRKLLVVVADCSITVRDLAQEQFLCVIEGHTSPPTAIQVKSNSTRLLDVSTV